MYKSRSEGNHYIRKEEAMAKIVVICIGTLSVSGDSLGPLVGDILVKRNNIDAYVYGNTASPVHGVNYADYIEHIRQHHKKSFVIAVDACVGKDKDIGKIKLSMSGVTAGGALNKGLERVGDIGLLGIVAGTDGGNNLNSLMNVERCFVDRMSKKIAASVCRIVDFLNDAGNRNAPAHDYSDALQETDKAAEQETASCAE